jgi:hypothetical protein
MNGIAKFAKVAAAGLLVAMAAGISGCYDDVGVEADYPSAEFVATASPVYYEGRPAYYYGNRWYYRDGNRWGAYRSEPAYLGAYRAQYRAQNRGEYRGYSAPAARRGGGRRR